MTAYLQVTDGRIDYIVFGGYLQELFATDVKASRWIDKATVLQVLKSQVFEIDGNDIFLPPPLPTNACGTNGRGQICRSNGNRIYIINSVLIPNL
jgi:hypothetical protein